MVLRIVLPYALVLIGIVFLIVMLIVFVPPKNSDLPELKTRTSGCVRSSLLSSSATDDLSQSATCDNLGIKYTEYYCDNPGGCRDPDTNERVYASKITTTPCQPTCVINNWNISVLQACAYTSQTLGNPCIEPGEIPQETVRFTCTAQDLRGLNGCIVTGTKDYVNQFITQAPAFCSFLPSNETTVKCNTGAVVDIIRNCQLATNLPTCGEYLVKTQLQDVIDPETGITVLPDSDPRTIDYKPCTSADVGLFDLTNDCYAPDQSHKYSGVMELFNVGVSRISTDCVKHDANAKDGERYDTNAVCKKASTYTTPSVAMLFPGKLDYTPGISLSGRPDCLKTCLYYTVPDDISLVDPLSRFSPIIGRYFIMIVHTAGKRYMISHLHSPCRQEQYIGIPVVTPFGDCLGKTGKYIASDKTLTLIDIDEVMQYRTIYGIMPGTDMCTEEILMEMNAAIFVADYKSGSSNTKRLEVYAYNQSKLGSFGVANILGEAHPLWSPISEDVANNPTPIPATHLDFTWLSDISSVDGTIRKNYSVKFSGVTINDVPDSNFPAPLTMPFVIPIISRLGSRPEIDITSNNPNIDRVEIFNIGERMSDFPGAVGKKITKDIVIAGRSQRTPNNCNLYFRLPVPADYN